jgi:prepilin-type N-terminal cleavage/methylation domain-containing protein
MNRSIANPRGFTLVELMVVISIIALLAALVSVAVARSISKAKEARIKLDVDNLAGAIEQYKSEYGSYPPSTYALLVAHVREKFPRALPQDIATIPTNMTPAEIVWFCIRGYTSDPLRPVDFFNPNAKRDEFIQFEQGRLVQTRTFAHNTSTMTPLQPTSQRTSPQRVFMYVPQEGKGAPYVYFDCSRNYAWQAQRFEGVGTGVARPYRTANGTYANVKKFQIISAGLDGDYGGDVTKDKEKVYPDGVNYTEGDKDNLVNFSERNLENSKP